MALSAARITNLPVDRIILLKLPANSTPVAPHATLDELISEGLSKEPHFVERRLNFGEAKKKLAFLNFSSGTTGKPKV